MQQRRIILIADDDADDREMLEDALREIDPCMDFYKVDNGLDALDYLENTNDKDLPDIIVLDYSMPCLTGMQVLSKLSFQNRFNGIPKFMWSSSTSKLYTNECLSYGAKYFVKPDSPAKLSQIAREILSSVSRHNTRSLQENRH